MRDAHSSLHVHAAEDPADVEDSHRRAGVAVIERFGRHGLLLPRTLLVPGVRLPEPELREAQAEGAWIVHCPRSNMNNAVGHAPTEAFRRAALGTDGLDEDMLSEARAAFLKMRDAGREDALVAAFGLLVGGHRLAGAFFRLPFGKLDAGAPADLAVLDYSAADAPDRGEPGRPPPLRPRPQPRPLDDGGRALRPARPEHHNGG